METNFNFKSQICTDKIQSERLLSLGLKKETADMYITNMSRKGINYTDDWQIGSISYCDVMSFWDSKGLQLEKTAWSIIPAWSLGRLIEMLPSPIHPKEELPSFSGCAYLNLAQIAVWYDYTDYDMDDRTLISWSGNGFFSAVVNCIEWLIKEGYFNKEYLV
jgi:hypothetical protein